jgi:hypothetical protein
MRGGVSELYASLYLNSGIVSLATTRTAEHGAAKGRTRTVKHGLQQLLAAISLPRSLLSTPIRQSGAHRESGVICCTFLIRLMYKFPAADIL